MIIIATLQKQIPDMLVIIVYNKDKACEGLSSLYSLSL